MHWQCTAFANPHHWPPCSLPTEEQQQHQTTTALQQPHLCTGTRKCVYPSLPHTHTLTYTHTTCEISIPPMWAICRVTSLHCTAGHLNFQQAPYKLLPSLDRLIRAYSSAQMKLWGAPTMALITGLPTPEARDFLPSLFFLFSLFFPCQRSVLI